MARQVPVGWEVAAGRRSFSAVSFRIRCLCRVIWQLRRGFLRNLLRFTGKDFRLPHRYISTSSYHFDSEAIFMSKNQSAAVARTHAHSLKNVRTLVVSAVLAAISVVLARLIIPMPDVSTRFSLEAVPIFLAGMFFGPIPGALVGFSADLVGCLFSGYGYNPLFCIPPILYGLSAGFFRPMLAKKTNPLTIGLAFLPAIVLGSILYQSWSLAFVYGGDAFEAFFLTKLASRSVQFGVTFVLDVLIVWLLYKAKVFSSAKLWPPVSGAQKPTRED